MVSPLSHTSLGMAEFYRWRGCVVPCALRAGGLESSETQGITQKAQRIELAERHNSNSTSDYAKQDASHENIREEDSLRIGHCLGRLGGRIDLARRPLP